MSKLGVFKKKEPELNQHKSPSGVYLNASSSPLMASTYKGYLVWPETKIPFLDKVQLINHKKRTLIENKIDAAINNDKLCALLWEDPEILAITLREASDVIISKS